jgi:hypothetical protein
VYRRLVSPPPQSGKAEGVPSLVNESGGDNVLDESHVSCILGIGSQKRTKTIDAGCHRLFFLLLDFLILLL